MKILLCICIFIFMDYLCLENSQLKDCDNVKTEVLEECGALCKTWDVVRTPILWIVSIIGCICICGFLCMLHEKYTEFKKR